MRGNKVLIIDSDLNSRSYLAGALQKKGYQTLQAGSGREGLIVAWRDRPALIIADPVMADLPGEELAVRLRSDPRTAVVPLIALSSDMQPTRQLACMEAGFTRYLVKSPMALASLIDVVAQEMPSGGTARKTGGLVMAFLSAKGGTGTSSLCANVAMNLGQVEPNARVAVADLVLPIGSIAGFVGYDGIQNLVTVAHMSPGETTPELLPQYLSQPDVWRFRLLAGSPDPENGNQLKVERIPDLISALKTSHDYVLIDLGRSLSRISLPVIEKADLVVMILSADMSTVALSKTVVDFLQSRGVQTGSIYVVLNRAVGLEGMTKAEIEKTLGLPIQTAIPYLGGNLSMANNQHRPYVLKYPRDTASIILKEAAQQMAAAARLRRSG
jgi:pilus assembly protein CpaE